MSAALRYCDDLLQQKRKGYICLTGVHGVMESQRDPALRAILSGSALCLPDGMPTVWIGRLQRHHDMHRVYGPDFMLQLCKLGARRGYRHFLYGGKTGAVVQKLQDRLERLVPAIEVVGTYSPPFRPLTTSEEQLLISSINAAHPDVIWVGLSTPKQEKFMARYLELCNTTLMIGVGAAFDIHAGLVPDAPEWIKNSGLQWLDRLCKEPRRLWRRYLQNNPRFLWNVGLQLAHFKRFELD
jgi:N-acetylglucosaminyldiphosphoundecaprenol N-acetyl-beta-D-mannosaminyltransferase